MSPLLPGESRWIFFTLETGTGLLHAVASRGVATLERAVASVLKYHLPVGYFTVLSDAEDPYEGLDAQHVKNLHMKVLRTEEVYTTSSSFDLVMSNDQPAGNRCNDDLLLTNHADVRVWSNIAKDEGAGVTIPGVH